MTTYRDEVAPVRRALRDLDLATGDDVARLLESTGIRGFRRLGVVCPLAVYLGQRAPSVEVHVGRTLVSVYRPRSFGRGLQLVGCAPLPWAARVFLIAFDQGAYEQLRASS